jgi:hypothetical protein
MSEQSKWEGWGLVDGNTGWCYFSRQEEASREARTLGGPNSACALRARAGTETLPKTGCEAGGSSRPKTRYAKLVVGKNRRGIFFLNDKMVSLPPTHIRAAERKSPMLWNAPFPLLTLALSYLIIKWIV